MVSVIYDHLQANIGDDHYKPLVYCQIRILYIVLYTRKGVPEAQWVKPWPADLVVVGSSPAGGRDLFNGNRGSIAHSLSLLSTHHPDLTEILLKKM